MQSSSINDTRFILWKKLVGNSGLINPTPPPPPVGSFLLLEDGSDLLLEDGTNFLLE